MNNADEDRMQQLEDNVLEMQNIMKIQNITIDRLVCSIAALGDLTRDLITTIFPTTQDSNEVPINMESTNETDKH